MGNTRILTQDFDYFSPNSLTAVFELFKKFGRDAVVIAGGTDVVPQLKYEVISPTALINLKNIPELNYIKEENGLNIGATARLRDVEKFCAKSKDYVCLHDALSSIGKIQVMNMGTLAGNLCTASPAADSAPALLVMDGQVKLSSSKGDRLIDLKDFFQGPRKTVKVFDELMTEVRIPPVREGVGSAFIKVARVGSDISKITCAVSVERKNDSCVSCKVAMGAVASTPIRIFEAESMLENKKVTEALLDEAGELIALQIQPMTDVRSTETYRRQIAKILFKDTFQKAWKRTGGEK
jgi:carbon-monoxide dehydrogenase medium subunit